MDVLQVTAVIGAVTNDVGLFPSIPIKGFLPNACPHIPVSIQFSDVEMKFSINVYVRICGVNCEL